MNTNVSEEEAIRQVMLDEPSGDFCDLADAVMKRFGLRVSSSLIEEVYQKLQRGISQSKPNAIASTSTHVSSRPREFTKALDNTGHIDIALRADIPKSDRSHLRDNQNTETESASGNQRDRILDFVSKMGGFNAARDAITDLERSLKQLMK